MLPTEDIREPSSATAAPLPSRFGADPARDSCGYRLSAGGEAGAAHTRAHAALDSGDPARGHRELSAWLASHTGGGSDWLHLHFHMALFELELGDWNAAYRRFCRELLPAAATTTDALTDAPGLLWRLALAAPRTVGLPWQALQRVAAGEIAQCEEPFVELHHLLALAGAGDLAGVVRWIVQHRARRGSPARTLVFETALALRALLLGRYADAAAALDAVIPSLKTVGGSRAQRELFDRIARWCVVRGPRSRARRAEAA